MSGTRACCQLLPVNSASLVEAHVLARLPESLTNGTCCNLLHTQTLYTPLHYNNIPHTLHNHTTHPYCTIILLVTLHVESPHHHPVHYSSTTTVTTTTTTKSSAFSTTTVTTTTTTDIQHCNSHCLTVTTTDQPHHTIPYRYHTCDCCSCDIGSDTRRGIVIVAAVLAVAVLVPLLLLVTGPDGGR